MSNIMEGRKGLVACVLEGTGYAARAQRRAAFDNIGLEAALGTLIEKVAKHAHNVTDEDISAVRAVGLSEDQIFEIVLRCRRSGDSSARGDLNLVGRRSRAAGCVYLAGERD